MRKGAVSIDYSEGWLGDQLGIRPKIMRPEVRDATFTKETESIRHSCRLEGMVWEEEGPRALLSLWPLLYVEASLRE